MRREEEKEREKGGGEGRGGGGDLVFGVLAELIDNCSECSE
jgi:hypothetical protein